MALPSASRMDLADMEGGGGRGGRDGQFEQSEISPGPRFRSLETDGCLLTGLRAQAAPYSLLPALARRTETRNLQYYILFSLSPRRLRSNWGAGGNIGIDGINRLDNQGGLARPVLSLVKKSPNRRSGFRRQSNRTRASGLGPASGDF